MEITLPSDIERDILAEVRTGHFATVDDAIIEVWREFRRQRPSSPPQSGDGLLGTLREDAELLDQIVE